MITIEFVQNLSTKSFVRCNSSALFVYVSVFYTVHFGYIIHWIYHPAAYIGHFRPEPNFSVIKPPDISSSPSVISATLRVAKGNCLPPVSFGSHRTPEFDIGSIFPIPQRQFAPFHGNPPVPLFSPPPLFAAQPHRNICALRAAQIVPTNVEVWLFLK